MALAWMKKGADSVKIAQQEEAEYQSRQAEQGKMWRFFVKHGEESELTFVDGELSPEGFLLPPRYYEHNLFLNGNWNNYFVCPEKTNPESGMKCPICEGGDRPNMVALFTVIDHRVFTSTKDSTKTHSNNRKLLVAKSITFELLNKIALERGGLSGARFKVTREGDKAAAVGSAFEFINKRPAEELQALYTKQVTDEETGKVTTSTAFEVPNYEEEIIFRTPEELRALGFGKPPAGGGISPAAAGKSLPAPKKVADPTDYESQL